MDNQTSDLNNKLEDEFNFVPLTDGLGFHKKEERTKVNVAPQVTPKKKTTRLKPLINSNVFDSLIEQSQKSSDDTTSLIDNFKKEVKEVKNIEEEVQPKKEVEVTINKQASFYVRFLALLGDLILITFLTVIPFYSLLYFNELTYLINFQVDIFDTIFLFYFWFLFSFASVYFLLLPTHFQGTPCQKLFGLKMVNVNNEWPSFKQVFNRYILSVFSLMALGMPILFDFPGKLSGTKLVKK